jgi:hypothetical protein
MSLMMIAKRKGKGLQVPYHKGTKGAVPVLILNFGKEPRYTL